MEITRKEFLRLFGGISGAVILGGFGLNQIISIPDEVYDKIKDGPRIEKWKKTICGMCPGGCGIQVRLIDDFPVYIKGNTNYPLNKGGMCPLGHASLQQLLHPERVKSPLKRVGIFPYHKWEEISWEEALKLIVEKLDVLNTSGRSQQVSFLGGNESNLMGKLINDFMNSYGSPNYYRYNSTSNYNIAGMLMHGHKDPIAYDLSKIGFILSLGANIFEEGNSPIFFNAHYTNIREKSESGSPSLIHVDSRMNLTSANADKWIPIKPGTYGALALGIAHILIREELYDKSFIQNQTFGFFDFKDKSGNKRKGFKNLVLSNYYPEKVAEITGVSPEVILELARDLENIENSIVMGGESILNNSNGTFSQMAIYSLNALLGNFSPDGGIVFPQQPPFKEESDQFREINQAEPLFSTEDSDYIFSEFSLENFSNNILNDSPYPLEMLFLYHCNPVFTANNVRELKSALEKIPLIVSFSSFLNETDAYAHLILPDHTYLEKWDEISNISPVGFPHIGIQQPVIKPLYDTRHTGDVLLKIADSFKGKLSDSFNSENYLEMIKNRVSDIYRSGKGTITISGEKDGFSRFLEERGWQIARYDSLEDFWELLLANGGWWDPEKKNPSYKGMFNTPSGKFEFYSQLLEEKLNNFISRRLPEENLKDFDSILQNLNIKGGKETAFMPHHENVDYDDKYPLHLTSFGLLTNREGNSSNLPIMQEMFGYTQRKFWDSWVEINPVTAKKYGIEKDDLVVIESARGIIKTKAVIHPGIEPSVVSVPFGMGHTSYGKYATGFGVNPVSIMNNIYDKISGIPALQATKVNIYLAENS